MDFVYSRVGGGQKNMEPLKGGGPFIGHLLGDIPPHGKAKTILIFFSFYPII